MATEPMSSFSFGTVSSAGMVLMISKPGGATAGPMAAAAASSIEQWWLNPRKCGNSSVTEISAPPTLGTGERECRSAATRSCVDV